ncbi:delta adaptin [Tieghemostelium lacteum]|uniref:AP-3 complex subunit delta n=1 Tax=Tieghemostelium lacteum TaxID=361077 RepID=A0A152A1J9_TIELA|nr:delta adaptin [Tieghemostelium lacteum]|eukprot:KYR00084.1 delta adaptin [Tieghemostelium lacteum]
MFERTLVDLIRGIRNHKKNETKFINQCIIEIKDELRGDIYKKTLAVQKLTYIHMLGYNIDWASFNIIEVLSSNKFTSKRIGYLAASQAFSDSTEVITLATNQIRKDFLSNNPSEAYLALNCLSNICTPDLARDLANDLLTLLSSQKTHVLKRTVAVFYKIFLKYPEALRPTFPKLKEKLEDPDPTVMSSAVNVICELARKNPKNYLPLAPVLFKILTNNSTNYWMLIKIVKLFAALTPHEPRLAKKMVDPLTNIINSSPSMSLLFECIQTCISGISDNIPLMKLCVGKLKTLIEHPDQNLKYLGLLALSNIMKIYPKAVSEHKELVLNCLDDSDTSIRMRALDLLAGMANKKNLPDIVAKLLDQLETAEGTYKDQIIGKIIELCSMQTYQFITDFEWYISVLCNLTRHQDTEHGQLIASQFLDVIIRVKVVRTYGTKQMIDLLKNPKLMSNPTENGICEVLYAAAWIIGEFAANINQPIEALEAFLQPRVSVLPAHIQSVYMLNALKIFSHAISTFKGEDIPEDAENADQITEETIKECLDILNARLPLFTQSIHLEVQERACLVNEILKFYTVTKGQDVNSNIGDELISIFTEQLNPVGPKAQKKVPIPEGLDLDEWINDPKFQEPEEEEEEDDDDIYSTSHSHHNNIFTNQDEDDKPYHHHHQPTKEELQRQREERLRKQAQNPYMLGGKSSSTKSKESDISVPVAILPESLGPVIVGPKKIEKTKAKPKKFTIDTTTEMPDGAKDSDSDSESSKKPNNAKYDPLSSINLNEPLSAGDILPVNRHRTDIQKEKELKSKNEKKMAASQKPGSSPTISYQEVTSPTLGQDKPKKPSTSKSKKSATSTTATSTSSSTSTGKTATTVVSPPALKKLPPVTLLDDENFKVSYEIQKTSQEIENQLKITFKLQNKSDEDMSDVKLSLQSVESLQSVKNSGEIGVLESSSSTSYFEILNVNNMISSHSLQFTLEASPSSSPELSVPLTIPLPLSLFTKSTKLTKDQFAQILQKSGTLHSSSTKVTSPNSNLQQVLNQLTTDLQFETVQLHPSGTTASCYTKTIQNHHIAMLVKERDGTITFDIKCSDPVLATRVPTEINQIFKKN